MLYAQYAAQASNSPINAKVRAASTANAADLAAVSTTMDGLTLVAGDRVLLKNQSTASQNGIYDVGTVSTGTAPLTRAEDLPAGGAAAGLLVEVEAGTANASKQFVCTAAPGSDIVGTNNLAFVSGAVVDSLLVHLAGTETVTGNKTFSGALAHTGTTFGLFGATPATQPTSLADVTPAADGTAVGTAFNALLAKLRALGVIAT